VNPTAWDEDIGKYTEAFVSLKKCRSVAGGCCAMASASGVAQSRLERVEKAGQAAGVTLERQAAFGRREKTNRYLSFFFSCFSFFFSLAVLLGFFFASFLVSLDLAIFSSLSESCHVDSRPLPVKIS
jgi:ABC-type Fe3+ transport system permease subunit